MSEAGEDVVEYWLFSKGYFIMRNLRVKKNREIDFLAITLSKPDERLGEKAHIEVHVAAYSRAIGYPISLIVKNIVRKFEDPYIVEEVVKRLGEHHRRVMIYGSYGRVKPDRKARRELFEELKKTGITVIGFEEVLKEVQEVVGTRGITNPAVRMIQYYKYIPEW